MSTQKIKPLLFEFLTSYKWCSAFYLIFGVFWAFTLPYMAYLFGQLVENLSNNGLNNTPVSQAIGVPLGLYVSIHVMRSFGYYVDNIFTSKSILDFKKKLIHRLFEHLSKQSIHYFEERRAGSLSGKITNVCSSLEPIIINVFNIILPQSLAIFINGVMLSTVVPYFGIVFWLWGIVLVIYTYQASKITEVKSTMFANACSVFNGYLTDVINNIQSVIYNASFEEENETLNEHKQLLINREQIRNQRANQVMITQHLAMNAMVAFFLISSVIACYHRQITNGDLVFVMTSITAIAGLTNGLANSFLQLLYHVGMLKDGISLLDQVNDVIDGNQADINLINRGQIHIQSIDFNYSNRKSIFQGFSLSVPAKQKLGIVGASGAGKSTLIKLITRLYDVQFGEIQIDGVNIKQLTKSALLHNISVVPQNINLFHRSISENIAYGCGDKSLNDIIEAAKLACCHELISALSDGYNTCVGEQGIQLSGGQRQRIAIARAILKNAPILLLDEATSALDSETEQQIQQALNNLFKDKTSLVVAHRLSTLRTMDRIIVIENGQIVEDGTHESLLDLNGHYHRYWHQQKSLPV